MSGQRWCIIHSLYLWGWMVWKVPPFMFVSLSKTATKQVLLDSLLQELCIKSARHSLAFEFTQAECPVLSVTNSRENNWILVKMKLIIDLKCCWKYFFKAESTKTAQYQQEKQQEDWQYPTTTTWTTRGRGGQETFTLSSLSSGLSMGKHFEITHSVYSSS